MSLISRFFKKHRKPVQHTPQAKPADHDLPARSTDALSELRHQARTGDPTLGGKHRSGTF